MGIKDWFRKKTETVEKSVEPQIELPELDKDALFEEAFSTLDSDEVKLEPEEVVETTPEYDSGEVDMNALLDDEMESNYDLNTVENTEFEDMLVDAKILGDLPEQIDFE